MLMDPLNFIDLNPRPAERDIDKKFSDAIQRLHEEGRYRVFINILRQQGNFPSAIEQMSGSKKEITVWCSNDYLGMG